MALLTGALQPPAHTYNNMFKTIDMKNGPGLTWWLASDSDNINMFEC